LDTLKSVQEELKQVKEQSQHLEIRAKDVTDNMEALKQELQDKTKQVDEHVKHTQELKDRLEADKIEMIRLHAQNEALKDVAVRAQIAIKVILFCFVLI
jgi:chromosome segregation ATPase